LGVMLLVFMPVPYVDASASAAFRSKWHRALVGGAGMLVETFIAALAVYVWLLSEPGTVRAIAYNTMIIAGLSTVLFNGNPLLRFDGYYILCDLIEIPNLGMRSNRFWGWLVEHYALGVEADAPGASSGERKWLVLYAPFAFAYRMLVLFGISIFVASSFAIVGIVIALWGLFANVVRPTAKALGHVLTSARTRKHRFRAVTVTCAATASLGVFLFLVPMPLHTTAEGVVWLPEDSILRASGDGFIKALAVPPGQQVQPGLALVESDEPTTDTNVRVLQSQLAALRSRLVSEQFTDRVQADLTREEIGIKNANLAREQEKLGLLVARSAAAGVFMVPRAEDLPGRYYRRGDVIGYVTPLSGRIVRAVVTQADIELVRNRLHGIELKLLDHPSDTHAARIVREVPAASERLPSKALAEAGGGKLASDPRDKNQSRTLQRTFQFDLELPSSAPSINFGGRVIARFDHGFEPMGWQWYRRVRQLFLSKFDA
jgi:putative peptide zinc metalloprotease protein